MQVLHSFNNNILNHYKYLEISTLSMPVNSTLWKINKINPCQQNLPYIYRHEECHMTQENTHTHKNMCDESFSQRGSSLNHLNNKCHFCFGFQPNNGCMGATIHTRRDFQCLPCA